MTRDELANLALTAWYEAKDCWRGLAITAVAVAFALVRIFGDVTGDDFASKCFKDAAHAYVALLFSSAYYTRSRGRFVLAVVLSLIELACFLRG